MKNRSGSSKEDPLDTMARSLLRAEPEGAPTPDAVFLAGFRRKLDEAREARASSLPLGELCWRLLPALGATAAALTLSSYLLLRTQPNGYAAGDEVLLSFFTQGPSEGVGDDLILSAALLEETLR
jgi:hypothetical protein